MTDHQPSKAEEYFQSLLANNEWYRKHKRQWIAIKGRKILAISSDLDDVQKYALEDLGVLVAPIVRPLRVKDPHLWPPL